MTTTPVETTSALREALLKGDTKTYGDLLRAAVAGRLPEGEPPEPTAPAPMPTDTVKAVKELPKVFGKVQPATVRSLTPEEIKSLYDERKVLDALKTTIEARRTGIRTTLFNHFDVEADQEDETADVERSDDGFYILEGVEPIPDTDQCFKREVRAGTPVLTVDALKALEEDPDSDFSHEDFLAVTDQIRVINEHALVEHLKKGAKRPGLLTAVASAVVPARKTVSLYIRRQK